MAESPAKRRRESESTTPQPDKRTKAVDDRHSKRITFDRNGDLLLNVRSFEHGGQEKTSFLVSTKVLSLASPVFNAMLNGRFVEGEQQGFGPREISLTDDDPVALMLLLNIIHFRYKLIPTRMNVEDLFQIAVVADKYDMVSVTKPFVKHHLMFHKKNMAKPGNEKYLFVLWAFGYPKDFKRMFNHLAHTSRVPRLTRDEVNEATDFSDVENLESEYPLVNEEGREFGHELPPYVLESLHKARKETLLLAGSYSNQYYQVLKNKVSDGLQDKAIRQCYAAELGGLVSHLADLSLIPWKTAKSMAYEELCYISVRDFLTQLQLSGTLRCDRCQDLNGEKLEPGCRTESENKEFRKKLAAIPDSYSKYITESLLKHVEDQEPL